MLSDAHRASLVARLRRGRENAPAGIPRRPAGMQQVPLSFGQEQLWFIEQLAPGLPTYNIAGMLRFTGALDTAALARAVDALVERHEVLRTRLIDADGIPQQGIDPPAPGGEWAIADLTGLPEDEREPELHRLAVEEAERPFALDRGPLFRTRLVRLGERSHALLIVVHHTVFDGWSFGVLTTELTALYEAAHTGRPPALPELPIQFADYALWERERLQGPALDELAGYWRETLAGPPACRCPRTARARSCRPTTAGWSPPRSTARSSTG